MVPDPFTVVILVSVVLLAIAGYRLATKGHVFDEEGL